VQAVTRILIVDDHETVRKGLKLLLDRHELSLSLLKTRSGPDCWCSSDW